MIWGFPGHIPMKTHMVLTDVMWAELYWNSIICQLALQNKTAYFPKFATATQFQISLILFQNKTIKMNKKIKKKGERKSNSHLIYYPGINSISVPGQRSSKKFWQSLGLSAYDLSHSEQWHPEWRSICLKINFIFLLLTAFIWYRMSLWTPNYSLTTAFLQPLCLWPWAQLPPWNAPPTTLCITHVSTHHLTRGSFICAMNAENKIHKIMKPTIQKYKITIFFKVWDTVWYLTHNKI